MEEWKDIEGYEGLYQISNEGRVKSMEKDKKGSNQFGKCIMRIKEKIMKPYYNTKGRLQVDLKNNGTRESKQISVLVAKAFIPNPNGYTNVHHIDEDKTNNKVENLMWMDESEHKAMHAAKRFSKKVYQYTINYELIKKWNAARECGRNGFNTSAVAKCCNNAYLKNGNNEYKGYRWSYKPL